MRGSCFSMNKRYLYATSMLLVCTSRPNKQQKPNTLEWRWPLMTRLRHLSRYILMLCIPATHHRKLCCQFASLRLLMKCKFFTRYYLRLLRSEAVLLKVPMRNSWYECLECRNRDATAVHFCTHKAAFKAVTKCTPSLEKSVPFGK